MPVSEKSLAKNVLVVFVSWNSAHVLGRALGSLPRSVLVTVVDNASGDGTGTVARNAGAHILFPGRNAGFGPACNLAAAQAPPDVDAFLLLNPDTEWTHGSEGLRSLVEELFSESDIAAVAPALTGDGQELFQLRKLPSLASLAREAFFINRIWPGNKGLLKERYLHHSRTEPFDVEQPAAAALLVRRDVFESLGGFDPDFAPAWFEDVDLCARIKKAGWRIRFLPGVKVHHSGGVTMRQLAYYDYLPLFTRNLFRYLRKHHSRLTGFVARVIIGCGVILRMTLLFLVRGDHSRLEAWRAYGRVLRGLAGLGWKTALGPLERR